MPDREVTCIRDIIYCQYAKIIAKSSFHFNDGREAKWADILREDWQQVETPVGSSPVHFTIFNMFQQNPPTIL